MFGKESEMRSEDTKLSTVIAKGTKIVGNVNMEGNVRVDGHIKGKVTTSEVLTIGKTGVVDGEVQVKEAVIGGKIKGNLVASQRVELESKATILGDVTTRVFVIKEGGVFHGRCSMQEGEKEKTKEKEVLPEVHQKPEISVSKSQNTKPLGPVPDVKRL
jgi:cytoskeletal protein CcmA (bactofilin family)